MKRKLVLAALWSISALSTLAKEPASSDIKPLTAQDLSEHGQKWAKQVIQKLSKEELSLLANYLYFNFLTTRYEFLLRTSFISCQNQLTKMQYLVASRPDEAQKCAELIGKQMAMINEEAIPVISYASKAAQACFEHIEDSDYVALKKVIVNLQTYSQSALNQFIHQDWPKAITKLFSTCSESMKKESEKLVNCQNELNAKVNIELNDNQDDEFFGEQFQEAINAAELSYGSYLSLISNTLNVKSMSADILNITAIINNLFYNHLFECLKTKKINSCDIMFDENGFIEEEDRDEKLAPIDEKFSVNKKHLKNN
ncbi:hypothetical protein BH09DEP1_BH09DEP1_2370 [soil metagenome]